MMRMHSKHFISLLIPLLSLAGCRHKHAVAPAAPAWLDAKVEEQAKAGVQGAERVGDLYRGVAWEDGGHFDWHFALDPSKCYWLSGVGDDSVRKLYLYLWDQAERRVAQAKPDSRMASMTYCPEQAGMYHLQAKLDEGAGHIAVGIYARDAPPKQSAPPPVAAPPGPDFSAAIERQARAAAPLATRVGELFEGSSSSGDHSDWFTALEAGNCYWFIGVGGPKVKKLYLYLWDPDDKRVTDNKASSGTAVMGHCAKVSGMFKVQAKVDSGEGPYQLGVYVKNK